MNRLVLIQALALLLPLCPSSLAAPPETVTALMLRGDAFDQKFQPSEALKLYLPAEKIEPKNVELLLRIARQYRHLMADATDVRNKIRFGTVGRGYAERAAAIAPDLPEAHVSVALSYAKMVPILGTKEKLAASRSAKAAIDKALALDPNQDIAWHLLGCWHQRLAEIGGVKRAVARVVYGKVPDATNEESARCLKKAIELNPSRLCYHVELGRTYAQMGKTSEARACLERGLAMPLVGKDDGDGKARARETLSQLK